MAGHPLRENRGYIASWLPNLLQYQLQKATNLPIFTIVPPNSKAYGIEENLIKFDYIKFFSFYNMGYNKYNWAELFYNYEYNEKAQEYIKSIFEDSLVVSYEMDYCILNILDNLNIPYIDMYISPVRFLDDQMFCMTTNNPEIYNKLLGYKLPEEQIHLQANYLTTFYRQRDLNYDIPNEPAVLFIGQTAYDRSLIDDEGKIYSILHHKEEFEESIKGYKKIFYKRHPKAFGDEAVMEYIKTLANVEIVKDNFYALCARPDIKKVVAISSGGVIEAQYFNKKTSNLLHPSVNLQYGSDFDKEKYINIYEHYFSINFWSDILSSIIETKKYDENIGFYGIKNKLRNSRGFKDWWGYQDFDHEMIKIDANSPKSASIKINKNVKKLARLLYHMTYNKNLLELYKSLD